MVGIFRIWRGFSSPDKRLNHTFLPFLFALSCMKTQISVPLRQKTNDLSNDKKGYPRFNVVLPEHGS